MRATENVEILKSNFSSSLQNSEEERVWEDSRFEKIGPWLVLYAVDSDKIFRVCSGDYISRRKSVG